MKLDARVAGATILLGATVALALVGDPTLDDELRWHEQEFDRVLAERQVHVSAEELIELMHDDLVRLRIVDVRDEADFNAFHLLDAERVGCDELQAGWGRELPDDAIVVLVGNDETRAESAWRVARARGIRNVYLLEGGLNAWMARFRDAAVRSRTTLGTASALASPDVDACVQDEPFQWALPLALGDRHAAALPPREAVTDANFVHKVQRASNASKPSGGCG